MNKEQLKEAIQILNRRGFKVVYENQLSFPDSETLPKISEIVDACGTEEESEKVMYYCVVTEYDEGVQRLDGYILGKSRQEVRDRSAELHRDQSERLGVDEVPACYVKASSTIHPVSVPRSMRGGLKAPETLRAYI